MPNVRIAAAALNQTPVAWEGNLRRATDAIEAAREQGARLVVLPELALSGYGCEDLYFAAHVIERAQRSLESLLSETKGVAVTVGLPLRIEGRLYNAMAMLADGELLGFSLKQNLANDGLHYEARWFQAAEPGQVFKVNIEGCTVPAGDLLYEFAGVGVGVEVCRDAWVEDRPARRWADEGVSLVLNPSASHFAFGKQRTRERLAREGAEAIGGAVVYVNLLGNESGRTIFDGGALIAQANEQGEGEIVGSGARFAYGDHQLTLADLELPERKLVESPRRVASLLSLAPEGEKRPAQRLDQVASKLEEFSHAVPLGLLDYLRKSGARGFVVSLSGGADSAACAVMVWLMVKHAVNQIGLAGLAERLPNTPGLADASDEQDAVRCLLTTVYQATDNSSDTTRDAAAGVAGAIGAEHHAWTIDPLVAGYTELASESLGRPLDWERDDVALQNIQARVRAPGVWMLANLKGALLLTTGNRSEAAVGYATMDGDTAGGLAPIAGCDKAFLLEWLRWMESVGPAGVGPLPALAAINAQQPTAELRPLAAEQTDESDLMPYPVLEEIERSAIARLEDRAKTVRVVTERHSDYSAEQIEAWVDRFWTLWRASQWKRERLAPGFHLDTHSLDPRGWRRWPILSGRWPKRES
ncbi:Glutamine-dependent NAD(+) synthetase [Planctomycetes bacterium MalM25]|nr:Glutamine-dependent NAD(+) synthetase [Planctomycetes bacterium MalM25]